MADVKMATARRDAVAIERPVVGGPPVTRSEDASTVMHGTVVKDPYRWLNDSDSTEVRRWVVDQNNNSRAYFDSSGVRDHIHGRLEELESGPEVGTPIPMVTKLPSGKLRYFMFRRLEGDEYKVLYYMDGPDGKPKVAIDPSKLSRDGKDSMIDWFPYDDGSKIAFTVSHRGSDVTTIRVIDLGTGKMLKDKIEKVTFASVEWTNEGDGFYYSRWPDLKNYPDAKRFNHVYYHKLGTPQERDKAIFGKGLGADKSCYVDMDAEGRNLFISVSDNVNNDLYYKKLSKNANPEIRVLIKGKEAGFYVVDVVGNTAYVLTNYEAPNGRVISFNLDKPAEKNWKTVIKESDMPIENITRHGSRLTVKYLRDGYSEISVFSLTGRRLADLDLPIEGSATLPFAGWGNTGYFHMESLVSSAEDYKLNYAHYTIEKLQRSNLVEPNKIDMSKYEMKQVWCKSKDGTDFPMFMINKKGIKRNGNNPVLLYGYGGFNLASEPDFNHSIIPFLEDGGVYVIANIRGGGEYGTGWYEAGMGKNKQNSYDDFISAAEWLIKNNYTNSNRLAITGRSNGGLLTAAVVAQRPDLFRAVVSEMPLTDIISADRFDIGPLCKKEYGDPAVAEEFEYVIKYSPYHNIKPGVRYPSVLVIGGENDTRCDPLHARKFAAIVQNSTTSGNPVLLLMQRDIGHGGSTMPVRKSQQLEWTTDWLTFIYEELGMVAEVNKRQLEELKRAG